MFKKVLIAEDFESYTLVLKSIIDELNIPISHYVHYCDDALDKIKQAEKDKNPYDLLITDLSFDEDFRAQKIKSGIELSEIVKAEHPNLKVIVFSIEDKPHIVSHLYRDVNVDAFVCKGRNDYKKLKQAIVDTYQNKKYISEDAHSAIKKNVQYDINEVDIAILKGILKGLTQAQIAEYFKANNYKSTSISSIEKKISNMKIVFDVKTNQQLISICKDIGII